MGTVEVVSWEAKEEDEVVEVEVPLKVGGRGIDKDKAGVVDLMDALEVESPFVMGHGSNDEEEGQIEEPLCLRAQLTLQQAGTMKRTLDLACHPGPALPLDYPPLPLHAATTQQHYSTL